MEEVSLEEKEGIYTRETLHIWGKGRAREKIVDRVLRQRRTGE